MKILFPLRILAIALLILGCSAKPQSNSEFYLLIGTYTTEGSEGIYVYKFNSEDGSLSYVSETAGVKDPSYLAVSPDHRFVYAVNERADSSEATVSAFSFDKANGTLSFLNKQSSGGGAPCYVSVDETGSMVFVGNYLGGSLAVFPVRENGSLGAFTDHIRHKGSSVNTTRQESPHVHCTLVTPDNKYLMVADLGIDQVLTYPILHTDKTLSEIPKAVFNASPGAGPRHVTFHPNGKFAYLVNELDGTVVAFRYTDGTLDPVQSITTLPDDYDGAISGADIHVSPDGRFLYASNRQDLNTIAIYSVNEQTGKLTYIDQQPSGGVHPRNFTIDPTGKFLLVANRDTDNVVVFRRDKETGRLTSTGSEVELSMPVYLEMIPAK
jgi:6-phosphogluconolactonase